MQTIREFSLPTFTLHFIHHSRLVYSVLHGGSVPFPSAFSSLCTMSAAVTSSEGTPDVSIQICFMNFKEALSINALRAQ